MKTKTNLKPASRLTPDSQSRLVAYTAAAGLGAFFGGQTVEGQVTESHALASYPVTLLGARLPSPYVYLDIDGDGTNDFKFGISHYEVAIYGTRPGNVILSPVSLSGYINPWTNGMTLNATTGHTSAEPWLAGYGYEPFYFIEDFPVSGPPPYELGFSFIGGDGKTHFGYMNIACQFVTNQELPYGSEWVEVMVSGIYYNKTPNAAIVTGSLPPVIVSATSIQVGAKNAVTINFTSSDNAAASAFTLETSPVLGASASWTTDTKAVISSSGPGVYQAVTTGTGGPSQFFRIKH